MIRNKYTPSLVRKTTSNTVGTSLGNVGAGITAGLASAAATAGSTLVRGANLSVRNKLVAEYLQTHGNSNPEFASSAAGDLRGPGGTRSKIQRGFIRRANNNNASNPLSGTSLKFMYNPEQITRDYLSYLDTAAIDPFNTIFQSGNLVNAPSMVQFSFELLFDRQVEETQSKLKRGVMVDYDYFDMVVRNVNPNGSTSVEVPDNGVMMVNPEDIVVVFSRELTVQGRPINSRVNFSKFNSAMVPTRMSVSITMVINYFGPLRDPLVFTDSTSSKTYESLVPYDLAEQTAEETASDNASVETSILGFKANSKAIAAAYNANARAKWWGPPAATTTTTTGGITGAAAAAGIGVVTGGVAGMVSPVNGDVQQRALATAMNTFNPGISPQYDQPRRTQIPTYSDCSSLVWSSFKAVGAQAIFGSAPWPTTASMLSFWQSSNWSTMQKIAEWSGAPGGPILLNNAIPGDILFRRKNGKGHVAFVQSVDKASGKITNFAAHGKSASPQVGSSTYTAASTAGQFEYLLRPIVAGGQTSAGILGKWFNNGVKF